MKKLFLFSAVMSTAITLITVSCDKTPKELLIGKWEVQYIDVLGYYNNQLLIDSTITFNPGDMQLEFFEGGTGKQYEDYIENETFTWSASENMITVTIDNESVTMPYTVTESQMTYTMTEEWEDGDDKFKLVGKYVFRRL